MMDNIMALQQQALQQQLDSQQQQNPDRPSYPSNHVQGSQASSSAIPLLLPVPPKPSKNLRAKSTNWKANALAAGTSATAKSAKEKEPPSPTPSPRMQAPAAAPTRAPPKLEAVVTEATAMAPTPTPTRPPAPARKPLSLRLREIEVQKLHKIDVVNRSFNACIWFEFEIAGGKHDPYLCAQGAVFPIGENGVPLFRPSAGWYVNQLDIRNALSYRVVDSKIMPRGDDLIVAIRIEGSFVEVFELDDYPFDTQGLTTTINFNCRAGGPLPIDIIVDEQCGVTMTCVGLCPPSKEWRLVHELRVRPHNIGVGERTFPAISFTAMVVRSPFYHML